MRFGVRMANGQIKWFDPVKGFGFIIPDDKTADVFLHARIVRHEGIDPAKLLDGTKVEFEPGIGRKGVQAIKVSVV